MESLSIRLQDRIRLIEAYFRGEDDVLYKHLPPLQIYQWWYKSYSKDEPIYPYEKAYRPRSNLLRLFQAGVQDFVMLPYSLIILVCIFCFVNEQLQWFG